MKGKKMELATTAQTTTSLARPLRVLVPLIKDDLRNGREAAERAGLPYYRAAGEKLIEAKAQMERGDFLPWVERNFEVKERQAQLYMSYARATASMENRADGDINSLRDFRKSRGELGGESVRRPVPDYQAPIDKVISKVDTELLNRRTSELKRVEERDAQRDLALQLIDIGYKALATKLHPDKGGSRQAMARLNQVRDRLKSYA